MDESFIFYFGILISFLWLLLSSGKLLLGFLAKSFENKNPEWKQRFEFGSPKIYSIRLFLFLSAFTLLLLSLGKTKENSLERNYNLPSADIIFFIDVSLSMNALDVAPTRLLRFQDVFFRILPQLKGNRIGVFVFAGQSFSYCPLTTDLISIKDYIQALGVDMVGGKGTDIASVFKRYMDTANKNRDLNSKVFVLVSDGEDHESGIFPTLPGPLYVWGLGSEEGGILEFRHPQSNDFGYIRLDRSLTKDPTDPNLVVSKGNPRLLQNLAQTNNGKYWDISQDLSVLSEFGIELKKSQSNHRKLVESMKRDDGSFPYLLTAIICLCFERMLSFFSQRTIFLLIFLFSFAFAEGELYAWELDPGGNANSRGIQAYSKKKYSESMKEFETTKSELPLEPKVDYNQAAALYKQEEYKKAIASAEKVLTNPKRTKELGADTYFLQGNAYAKMGDVQSARQSYVEALKENPKHEKAKKNLEFLEQSQKLPQKLTPDQNKPKESLPQNQNSESILDLFSKDSILKKKLGGDSYDREKFW